MKCPNCGESVPLDEKATPKGFIRKILNEFIDGAQTPEDKLKAVDLLSKLEGYTGYNARKEEKEIGVMILHHSKIKRIAAKGPGIEKGDGKA